MYNQHESWGPGNYKDFGVHDWGGPIVPLWIGLLAPMLILVVLWSVFWKGLALWHAARRGQPWWFVAMIFINTIGILEIIYLFGIARLSVNQLLSRHAPHEL